MLLCGGLRVGCMKCIRNNFSDIIIYNYNIEIPTSCDYDVIS